MTAAKRTKFTASNGITLEIVTEYGSTGVYFNGVYLGGETLRAAIREWEDQR